MNVITVEKVSKSFKSYKDRSMTLKERILHLRSREFESFKILDDVSLNIAQGETVALLGHNGCGKSTLLKLISRIIYPDEGKITINGKIIGLLELGAGFHQDFSGRENIYINAAILGLKRKEIDKIVDDVIAFSELGEFIDAPLRTYSSGMYMRLAFAVAINVKADIMLIDEILAVGDAGFQRKCFNKLQELKQSGMTIVLVTHDIGSAKSLCGRGVWINDHRIVMDGDIDAVGTEYLKTYD